MTERIAKFLICIVLAPFLALILIILAALMVFLPLVALIYPQAIKIGGE